MANYRIIEVRNISEGKDAWPPYWQFVAIPIDPQMVKFFAESEDMQRFFFEAARLGSVVDLEIRENELGNLVGLLINKNSANR
jgi:hypothetical protein